MPPRASRQRDRADPRSRARRSIPLGSRVNERGPPRGRRLRRGRARRRVRHPRLRLRRGRHARPRPRLPRRLRARGPTTSRSSSPARRCPAPPPTGSSPRRGSRSTSPPAASCTWRCAPASTRRGSTCTATTRPTRRSCWPSRPGVGHLILDSFDEIDRCERLLDRRQRRADPGHAGDQALDPRLRPDRPARLEVRLRARGRRWRRGRSSAVLASRAPQPGRPARPHRLADLRARALHAGDRRARRAGRRLVPGGQRRRRPRRSPTPARTSRPRSTPTSTSRSSGVAEVFGPAPKILVEPGRSLVGNAGVTAYTVGTVKEIPGVRTYVAVDGGMSDNLRPMLYGSRYEALIADRAGAAPDTAGDDRRHALRVRRHPRPRRAARRRRGVGDVLVTPATGAYGYAMANNYNGVPRPPVVFCRDGDARSWSGARPTRT